MRGGLKELIDQLCSKIRAVDSRISIVDSGAINGWYWRKWSDGIYEAWWNTSAIAISFNTLLASMPQTPTQILSLQARGCGNGFAAYFYHVWNNGGNIYGSGSTNGSYAVSLYVVYKV